jgi:CelD/BcsL family acetyltransferase involved in cellulose biosynthesis/sterol desaturase/sphingolipid hydroxylase (fatty acid hydroxylase superfamily)
VTTLVEALSSKLSPENLIALGLLFVSSLAAAAAMFVRSNPEARSPSGFVRFMFPADVFRHPSARADLLFWVTRKMLMPLLLLPAAGVIIAAVGYGVHTALGHLVAAPALAPGPAGPWVLALFTVSALLAYDFSYYVYHVVQHRIPVFWELHKVHHSAEVMVGITKDRIHPLDEVMNRLWDGVVVGTVYGFWLFFAMDPVEVTIFGINVYILRNILMMDLVRHTHLKVSFGRWMNAVVLCPHYHQLHHSTDPKHFDRNFGLMLSVWDKMFGTLAVPMRNESFSFGLGAAESRDYQSLHGLYVLPLQRMAARIWPATRARTLPNGADLRFEIVRDEGRLVAIGPEWSRLETLAGSSVFQSHAWIMAWWRAVGTNGGYRLKICLAWSGENLVGVLPLVTRWKWGLRVLEWAAKDCADYCDAMLAPRPDRFQVLAEMWKQTGSRGGFDIGYLSHVRPDSNFARRAQFGPCGPALSISQRKANATALRLDFASSDAWFQTLGKKGRNNYQRCRRILEESGPVSLRQITSEAEIAGVLDRLYTLKIDWLARTGMASPVLDDGPLLLRGLVDVFQRTGRLRLFVLECGDTIVAGSINFVEGHSLRAFLAAFDPAFHRGSPGSVIMVDYVKWAIDQGLAEVDFLCGDEEYKGRFANQTTTLSAFEAAPTIRGKLALAARKLAAMRGERSGPAGTSASPGIQQPVDRPINPKPTANPNPEMRAAQT